MNVKLLRTNLLVLLGYAVVFQCLSLAEPSGGSMVVLMGMMVAVAAHVGVLVLGAVVNLFAGKGPLAGQWLLSALLVGVIPNLARLVMSPIWGRLFDRMNFFILRIVLNCGFALGMLSFFGGDHVAWLVLGAIIYGVSNAGGDVAWSLWVTKFAPPERVADYMSVHTFFTGLRGVVAPVAAFWMVEHFSLAAISWLGAIMIVFATLLLIPEIKFGKSARPGAALTEEVSE